MGIKFHCPNGHKINVKAFLAGRRGVCPACGAKFDIPFQSDPAAVADNSPGVTNAGAIEESTDTIVLDPPYLAAPPTPPAESWSSPQEPVPAGHDSPAAHAPTKWYIRIGNGEQFGPVRDEQMHQWLDQGQIVAATPLWRDGWAEWQPAATVFRAQTNLVPTPPEVPIKQMSSGDLTEALAANRSAEAPASDRPAVAAQPQPPQPWTAQQWTTVISLSLLGAIVVLGITILVMLLGQTPPPEPQLPPPQPPAAKSPLGALGHAASLLA